MLENISQNFYYKKDILDIKSTEKISSINMKIIEIMEKSDNEKSSGDLIRLSLLNRLSWSFLVINTIDKYKKYNDIEIRIFFLALGEFIDILKRFANVTDPPDIKQYFEKTIKDIEEKTNSVNKKYRDKVLSFIRALSFAHTTATDKGGNFLSLGKDEFFTLIRIDVWRASFPIGEPPDPQQAFYFHTILKTIESCRPIIFSVYVEEIRKYVQDLYNSKDFSKLK